MRIVRNLPALESCGRIPTMKRYWGRSCLRNRADISWTFPMRGQRLDCRENNQVNVICEDSCPIPNSSKSLSFHSFVSGPLSTCQNIPLQLNLESELFNSWILAVEEAIQVSELVFWVPVPTQQLVWYLQYCSTGQLHYIAWTEASDACQDECITFVFF